MEQVNHPTHYASKDHPAGVECIELISTLPYCLGAIFKYIYRAERKGKASEDYRKAAWYVLRYKHETMRDSLYYRGYVLTANTPLSASFIRWERYEKGLRGQAVGTLVQIMRDGIPNKDVLFTLLYSQLDQLAKESEPCA